MRVTRQGAEVGYSRGIWKGGTLTAYGGRRWSGSWDAGLEARWKF